MSKMAPSTPVKERRTSKTQIFTPAEEEQRRIRRREQNRLSQQRRRAKETPEKRRERLDKDKERYRLNRKSLSLKTIRALREQLEQEFTMSKNNENLTFEQQMALLDKQKELKESDILLELAKNTSVGEGAKAAAKASERRAEVEHDLVRMFAAKKEKTSAVPGAPVATVSTAFPTSASSSLSTPSLSTPSDAKMDINGVNKNTDKIGGVTNKIRDDAYDDMAAKIGDDTNKNVKICNDAAVKSNVDTAIKKFVFPSSFCTDWEAKGIVMADLFQNVFSTMELENLDAKDAEIKIIVFASFLSYMVHHRARSFEFFVKSQCNNDALRKVFCWFAQFAPSLKMADSTGKFMDTLNLWKAIRKFLKKEYMNYFVQGRTVCVRTSGSGNIFFTKGKLNSNADENGFDLVVDGNLYPKISLSLLHLDPSKSADDGFPFCFS